MRERRNVDYALRRMAIIAGYRYEDCNNGKEWFFDRTWTQYQSDRFKKWFMRRMTSSYLRDKYKLQQYGMFDLMYGFKIVG